MSLIYSLYDHNVLQIDVSDMKTEKHQFKSFSNQRLNYVAFTVDCFCAIAVPRLETTFKLLLEK